MFRDLPKPIQREVCYHLANQDFESAKAVHDQWMMKNHRKITNKELSSKVSSPADFLELL